MARSTPTGDLHPGFSAPDAVSTPWDAVVDVLDSAELFWISTVRSDGRPHVTPLLAVWHDGAFHHGPGAAHVYEVRPRKVLSFAKGEFAQTRFRFDD